MDLKALANSVGKNVRKARRLAGASQEQAASRMAISCRYLSEVESGRANASLHVLGEIAQALDVEVVDLVETEKCRPMRPPLFQR